MGRVNKITFQEEGHIYKNEAGTEIPSVSAILEHFGISDFSKVPIYILEASQQFGKVVHKVCEIEDEGSWSNVPKKWMEEEFPKVEPWLNGWRKFKEDFKINMFLVVEIPLYSKVWSFAGTPDRANSNILVDIKTGVVSKSHRIQTAFYDILLSENLDFKIRKRYGVYLNEGGYKLEEHKDKTDLSIAKSLISLYNWKKSKGIL